MRKPLASTFRTSRAAAALLLLFAASSVTASLQTMHQAPADSPSNGRLAPDGEPGMPLHVTGIVVGPDGSPIPDVSLYVYQTDHEGYYGVKPASDNRNPRLKLFLRTDKDGSWAFDTVKPGSYPNSRVPPHIHFEVSAPGHTAKVFEIVFAGDPYVTDRMRSDSAFSVRPIANGRVTQRIVLK